MAQHSGWYEDPFDPDQLRYWDGILWTNRTTPKVSPTARQQPAAGPTPGAGSGGPEAPGGHLEQPVPYWRPSPWVNSGPVASDGTPLARWWQRLLARILDNIVTGVIGFALAWPWVSDLVDAMNQVMSVAARGDAAALDSQLAAFQRQMGGVLVPIVVIGLVVSLLYETSFLVAKGATPGKLALGMRVRRVEAPGPLSVTDALRRQAITVGTGALQFVPLLGTFASIARLLDDAWLLWDPRRQCLHDKVADTVVVVIR